jgi:hypothetical protein
MNPVFPRSRTATTTPFGVIRAPAASSSKAELVDVVSASEVVVGATVVVVVATSKVVEPAAPSTPPPFSTHAADIEIRARTARVRSSRERGTLDLCSALSTVLG